MNPRSCIDSAVLFDGAHAALGEVSLVLKYLNNAPTGATGVIPGEMLVGGQRRQEA